MWQAPQQSLEGYKISKIADIYVFEKDFETVDQLYEEYGQINLFTSDYIVLLNLKDYNGYWGYYDWYGTTWVGDLEYLLDWGYEFEEITMDEFKDGLQLTTFYESGREEITIFDSKLVQPIYRVIVNAIVSSTMDIEKSDIISSTDNPETDDAALNILVPYSSISRPAILASSPPISTSTDVVVGDLNNNVSDRIADNIIPAISFGILTPASWYNL